MKTALKYFRLSSGDKALVRSAMRWLTVVRLGLPLFPFSRFKPWLERASRKSKKAGSNEATSERVAWAVTAVGATLPFMGNCLVQALATQIMLNRRRLRGDLRIGVVKEQSEKIEAHAWVEGEGKILIGGPDVRRFTPLAAFGREEVRTLL